MPKQESKDAITLLLEADGRGETTPEQHAVIVEFRAAMAAILVEEI